MGHVPAGPVSAAGPHHEFPGRQHRGTRTRDRALANQQVARLGEALAAAFLERRGATVVGRNIRSGRGEIDLLVRWPGILVAVEVKTRAGADPRPAYTAAKSRAVRRAIHLLRPRPRRLDLIAIELGRRTVDIRWVPGVV